MRFAFIALLLLTACGWRNDDLILARHAPAPGRSALDFTMVSLTGEAVPLSRYRGNVVLIFNTASTCGLTPQYRDLEALYQKHNDKGLVILGFPDNDFMKQEPGDSKQILEFCQQNYGVSFPAADK
jgi:glutathione peroxidase